MNKKWVIVGLLTAGLSVMINGCGSVSNSKQMISDPPLEKAVYVKQGIDAYKPCALEFFLHSPSIHSYPWNIMRMWFPEVVEIHDGNGKNIYSFKTIRDPAIWEYTDKGLRAECELPGGGKLVRSVEKNGTDARLDLSISYENKSNTNWTKVCAYSCFQMSATSDYEDNIGERTFWVADGVPTPTNTMAIADAGMRISAGVGKSVKMKNGSTRTITEGVAFLKSKDGKYVLCYSWQPASSLFCNRGNIVACLHVEPPSFDLPAGHTKIIKGIIFIHEGSLEEAYKQFLEWKNSIK